MTSDLLIAWLVITGLLFHLIVVCTKWLVGAVLTCFKVLLF